MFWLGNTFGLRFELRLGLGFQFGFDQGLRFEL